MQTTSLTALVHEHLTLAREATSGRSPTPSTAATSTHSARP